MTPESSTALMTSPTAIGRYRWIVCGMLFFATTINYMDRQILSLLKPILDSQMGWTNEQFGAVDSALGGENQRFADMDVIKISDLE